MASSKLAPRSARAPAATAEDAAAERGILFSIGGMGSAANETLEIVRRTLDRLPAIQREAFVLLRFEGLSVRQAAQVLGASEAAVKVRAFRAYEALRSAIHGDGEGGSRGK